MTPGDNRAAADLRRALIEFHDALSVRVATPAPRPALDLASVVRRRWQRSSRTERSRAASPRSCASGASTS